MVSNIETEHELDISVIELFIRLKSDQVIFKKQIILPIQKAMLTLRQVVFHTQVKIISQLTKLRKLQNLSKLIC